VTDEALRHDLRAAGLRATAPRLAVLGLLRRASLPLSHPDVVGALADHTWDRATLYRNLTDLVRTGLARRTDLGDRVWRFEATGRAPAHRHPHFVCHDCGSVQCLDGVEVHLPGGAAMPTALHDPDVEVQFKGRCDQCREVSA
jgi:Fur family ferric uptake transcriptional regulator